MGSTKLELKNRGKRTSLKSHISYQANVIMKTRNGWEIKDTILEFSSLQIYFVDMQKDFDSHPFNKTNLLVSYKVVVLVC